MIPRNIYLRYVLPFITAVLFVPIILTGCKSNPTSYNTTNNTGGSTTPPANEVWMQNTSYNPKTETISTGTKITWINKDSFNHTVTSGTPGSPSGLFDSGVIGSGGTFSHTFNTPGTFNYYCSVHQEIMTGTITVQ